jgi:hypothetical protein
MGAVRSCADGTRASTDGCELDLTILMPCLNEAETLATCITKAQRSLERSGLAGEVLIADNGSTDRSVEIAEQQGARVTRVAEKGYGAALRGGIEAARGRWIIMGTPMTVTISARSIRSLTGSWLAAIDDGPPYASRRRDPQARSDALVTPLCRQPLAVIHRSSVL